MTTTSDAYRTAEREMAVPPVAERGRRNENPTGIGFWALVAEDFRTHERRPFEQGFWAIFTCRVGNWRMGQPKIVRAPATVLYWVMFKLVEVFCGISLWYTTKLGRRVRIWHHSGMVLGCRAIGDDVQIRQNTTFGVGQTGMNDQLPIIRARADIGAGACVAGAVVIGEDAKIGGNALVVTDVAPGATVMGNPAQVVSMAARPAEPAPEPAPAPALAPVATTPTPAAPAPRPETPVVPTPIAMGTLALLGSANLDYLAMSVEAEGRALGLAVTLHVPPFGTARMELLQPREASGLQQALHGAEQAATLIVERAEDVLGHLATQPLALAETDRGDAVDEALAPMLQIVRDAREKLPGPILVTRLAAFSRSTLALADGHARGRAGLIEEANARLAEAVAALDDVHLIDTQAILTEVGLDAAAPGEFWHMGRVPFADAFARRLARRSLGALLALRGKTARLVVLDLDNTLWGGVLGEDGIEGVALGGSYPGTAYKEFQASLRALADRGIALAVASKNDEDLALKMIAEHPEMALRPDDLIAHRIDWSEKALNIQAMLDEIGLGQGSCLFIDDNPVERAKVRQNLPSAIVPDFPDAPEKLAPWLLDNPFLETLDLTASDLKRTRQYKVRAQVNAAKRTFHDVTEFYRDLDMGLTFEPFDAMNQQRVLQLFVKTNQFNATTRRHDAGTVRRILDEGGEVFAVGVADRHSEYELMGVLVLRADAAMAADYPGDAAVQDHRDPSAWWIDSFLMSCRILGRTIEQAILAWATGHVAAKGASALVGQIVETPRNTPVRRVFATAGFDTLDEGHGLWVRRLAEDGPIPVPDYFRVSTPDARAEAGASGAQAEAAKAPAPTGPATAPIAATAAASLDPAVAARLEAAFRTLFNLAPETDLSTASMETVPGWDSLGHLKLAMEVERTLGVRLPGEVIGRIATYPELVEAVAERTGAAAA